MGAWNFVFSRLSPVLGNRALHHLARASSASPAVGKREDPRRRAARADRRGPRLTCPNAPIAAAGSSPGRGGRGRLAVLVPGPPGAARHPGAAPRLGVPRRAGRARGRRGGAAQPHGTGAPVPQPPRFVRGRRHHGASRAPPDTVDAEPRPAHLARARTSPTARTASGSRAVVGARARVARASRILVEGVHDAELVEQVWGDDLRVEGVVVERLDGADHLADVLAALQPGPGRAASACCSTTSCPGARRSASPARWRTRTCS